MEGRPLWLRIIWIIAILNFFSFVAIAMANGGDAVNGKVEGGKYFVANHGRYTEVSKVFSIAGNIRALRAS